MTIYPINFPDTYLESGHTINYSGFMEITQGGPEVGNLFVDSKMVGTKKDYFGGPPAFVRNVMVAPLLKQSFLSKYFKVCVINLDDLSMREIGDKEQLILITKVDGKSIQFFTDLANIELKSIPWN
jgi:hypothetical protein